MSSACALGIRVDELEPHRWLANVARIHAGLNGPSRVGYIDGFLEKVARDRSHRAHGGIAYPG